ncbi:hypothetical protein DNK47_03115, partial [Mycoplasma wenyonii]
AIGVGGVGTALWTSGIFSSPYESKWYGEVAGLGGADLVCGKSNDKYDCKLSLPFSLISSSSGGGIDGKVIKVSNISEIKDTTRNLYLFDKDKSTLWYIFSGSSGPLRDSWKVTIKNQKPVVQLCREKGNCDSSGQPKCCGPSFSGQKIDEGARIWNSYEPKPSRIVSARNLTWRLSYL